MSTKKLQNHLRLKYCILNTKKGGFICNSCEKIYETYYYHVDKGNSNGCKSCATIKTLTTHNMSKTKLYSVYNSMKDRCTRKNARAYKYYGSRGITVCDEWINNFHSFHSWAIRTGYKEGLTIDRINNSGNYEPLNCRWATREVQQTNTRVQSRLDVGIKKIESGRFIARICRNHVKYYLGVFNTKEEAINARQRKREELCSL